MPHPPARLLAPLLAVVLVALTWPWRDNPFYLDDLNRVVDNPGIERVFPLHRHFLDPSTMSTRTALVAYRPLLPLSLSLDHALHGGAPAGYRLTNALLHVLGALALLLVAGELAAALGAPGPRAAAAAAILFALHPVGGIPIQYVCVRDLQLATLFTLLGLAAHARLRRLGPSPARRLAPWACLVLGMLAKTDAIALPALFLAWDLLVARRAASDPDPWARAGLGLALAAALVAFPVVVLGSADLANIVPGERSLAAVAGSAATQLRLHALHYPLVFLAPWRIRQAPAAHPVGLADPGALAGLALLLGSLALAARLRNPRPATAFAIVAYWLVFAPSSSLVPLHPLAVDYRALPASAFVALLAVLELFPRLGPALRAPAFAALAALLAGVWTYQARLWSSEAALWGHSVALGGDPMAWQGLALATADRSRRLALLDEALARQPDYVLAHTNRGLTLIALGRLDEGLEACRRAVELDPRRDHSHHWLGRALLLAGRPEGALQAFRAALALNPTSREHRLGAAEAALAQRDHAAARVLLEPLVAGAPTPAVLGAWGKALFLGGERERGAAASRAAAEAAPGDAELVGQAGTQLLGLGRAEEALPFLRRLATLLPGHPRARAMVAFALQGLGRHEEAAAEYLAHLEANPGDTGSRLNLVLALQAAGRPCPAWRPHLDAILRAEPAHPGARRLRSACPDP